MPTGFHVDELGLLARNHGLPLEALREPITPVGMHFTLSHFDIPALDAAAWRLAVGGLVERPLTLSLADLQALPHAETTATLECAGNGRAHVQPRPRSTPWLGDAVGTARWAGTALAAVLDLAGVQPGAVELVFSGSDRGIDGGSELAFQRSLAPDDARATGAIVAWEMNGAPIPPQHGHPVRLIVPGWYGMASVKWLVGIEAVAEPFLGHYQAGAYNVRFRPDDPGERVTRMLPRSLLVPPGIPAFVGRHRTVDPGPAEIVGRAWSGMAAIASVEVSADGGTTWAAASVERDLDSAHAWIAWRFAWHPQPGEHVLCCRARDEAGFAQPLEHAWNLGGYANNAVQRVPVTVRE